MRLNEVYSVKITGLDHYGRGIGKIDNLVVFVPDSLIGELVEVKITNIKKNFLEGVKINVLKVSTDRVDSLCPHFDECGGCDLMHMSYRKQLLYKENKVKEIMKKFANIDEIIIKPIIESDNNYNYRNKVTFQVKKQIGFYKKKSYDIVEVDNCLISDQKINNIANVIKRNIDLKNVEQLIIRSSKDTHDIMVIFNVNDHIDENAIVNNLEKKVTSIIIQKGNKFKTLYGKDYIVDKIGDLKFVISPTSFFQINTAQTDKLYNQVLKYSELQGAEKILDLYCGTGTIGLYLSKYCKEVLGIEINNDAIKDAFKNKEMNQVTNIDFRCGDVSNIINDLQFNPDIIIVDPPRSGLDNNTINQLLKINSKKIIYVSCDPITLARDLKILQQKYDVVEITPVDMFANTYHVECVCKLVNKKILTINK